MPCTEKTGTASYFDDDTVHTTHTHTQTVTIVIMFILLLRFLFKVFIRYFWHSKE